MFIFIFTGIVIASIMSIQTLKYYQSKPNQWFGNLPASTILAVKLNPYHFDAVQNTKIFGVLQQLNFDPNLIDEFIYYKKPITLLLSDSEKGMVSSVITNQDYTISNIDQFRVFNYKNEQVIISDKNQEVGDLKTNFDQSLIKYQIKNHPSTSFGYVAFSPRNFQKIFFKDQLLTPNQKAVESILKQYDNVFFNIELDNSKLYLSNYTEQETLRMPILSLSDLVTSPKNPLFHLSLTSLEPRLPKILNLTLEKLLSNYGISKNLYQKLLQSQFSISLDQNQQWHIVIRSQEILSQSDLEKTMNFFANYFNPIQEQRTLKTNQDAQINLSQNTKSMKGTSTQLKSINKVLSITPQSKHIWNLHLSNTNTSAVKPKLNFQPKTISAFENVLDYSHFRLDFLNSVFQKKLPAYSLEIFQRDYKFGHHTLIVIE